MYYEGVYINKQPILIKLLKQSDSKSHEKRNTGFNSTRHKGRLVEFTLCFEQGCSKCANLTTQKKIVRDDKNKEYLYEVRYKIYSDKITMKFYKKCLGSFLSWWWEEKKLAITLLKITPSRVGERRWATVLNQIKCDIQG